MRAADLTENLGPKAIIDTEITSDNIIEVGTEIAGTLKRFCGAWLSETNEGKSVVVRGYSTGDYVSSAFTKKVRQSRRPLSSSAQQHKLLNILIQEAGKRANRSNSTFVKGGALLPAVDINEVGQYGKVYYTFPVGRFKYTWHTEIRDWYLHTQEFFTDIAFGGGTDEFEDMPTNLAGTLDYVLKNKKLQQEFFKGLKGDDGSLIDAIQSDSEIMIASTEVIAVDCYLYRNIVLPIMFGHDPQITNNLMKQIGYGGSYPKMAKE